MFNQAFEVDIVAALTGNGKFIIRLLSLLGKIRKGIAGIADKVILFTLFDI